MKTKGLNDLELYQLLCAAYPERFTVDEDETWDEAMEFAEEISGVDDIADLLGRVLMLTMPVFGPITGTPMHCLGTVKIIAGVAQMTAAVTRNFEFEGTEK